MNPALILLTTTIWVIKVINSEAACGAIGTNEHGGINNRALNFYLNTQDPALCNGTVSYFQFCYYRPVEIFQLGIYKSTFAIYRRNTDQPDSYDAFTPVFVANRTNSNLNLGFNNLTCASLPLKEPVRVQVGDVIGACIFQPQGFDDQLDIVGSGASSERYLMTTRNTGCGDVAVPSSVNSLDQTDSLILHINANIVPAATEGPSMSSTETTSIGAISIETTGVSSNTTGIPTEGVNVGALAESSTNTTDAPTGGINGGVVAAAVIAVSIILVLLTVIVVLVVLLVKKHKLAETDNCPTPKPTSCIEDGIGNIIYEVVPHNGHNSRSSIATAVTFDESLVIHSDLLEKNKRENIYGLVSPYQVPSTQEDDIYTQINSLSVPNFNSEEIEVVDHLGSGQFGNVKRGLLKRDGIGTVDVALKVLIADGPEDRVKFLQEAAIMAQFRHPNVILLHGVLTKEDQMMLVVELAKKGDLKNFLRLLRPDPGELITSSTPNQLLMFSQQVALGMQYLSAKGFVHRDLAARNVLVSACNICKISDFGMSRDLADESYYISHGGMIPVKWTAPEAIHYMKYSTASDVWAYGCLLYEIWSIGQKPFEDLDNANAVALIDAGKRLAPPPGCPEMVYELMILCWNPEAFPRPCFRDIVLTLTGSEGIVLNIPWEDSSTHPLAGVLGAPLEAGENMYTDLQQKYVVQSI